MSEHFQNIHFSSYKALRRHKSRADCYNWVYVTLLDFFPFSAIGLFLGLSERTCILQMYMPQGG